MQLNSFEVLENITESFSQGGIFKLFFIVKLYLEGEQRASAIKQHRPLFLDCKCMEGCYCVPTGDCLYGSAVGTVFVCF